MCSPVYISIGRVELERERDGVMVHLRDKFRRLEPTTRFSRLQYQRFALRLPQLKSIVERLLLCLVSGSNGSNTAVDHLRREDGNQPLPDLNLRHANTRSQDRMI
jgi:hypothetical protein